MTTDCNFMRGLGIFAGDSRLCVAASAQWVASGDRPRCLACLNPRSYVEALRRPDFARALEAADWLVPDGSGVTLASRVLNAGIDSRVTGTDVFEGLSRHLDAWAARGSTSFYDAMAAAINAVRPDVPWVGGARG